MAEAARRLEALEAEPERAITLLELVVALVDAGASEQEVVSSVARLVNSGRVRLIGSFRGADVRIA
jgi:hypothetical protein